MIIIKTTYPNKPRQLRNFMMSILGKKLAVCINRLNYVKSYYIWEGKIQKSEEKILLIKTREDKKDALIKHIEKNHPYDVPEISVIKTDWVNEKYLEYLEGSI